MEKSWYISRRRMLKGMGACIALPLLEAMIPPGFSTFSGANQAPRRMACMYMANGVNPYKWTPEGWGKNFALSPILQPLKNVKDQLNILGELYNRNSDTRQEGHFTKTANFLTSMRITKTVDSGLDCGGVSMDQLVANHIGKETMFPSLQYGVDRIDTGICKSTGFTRLYGSSISWASRNQPCAKEIDPRLAFDRIFRNYVPGKPPVPYDPNKKSVLDIVQSDAQKLNRQLGVSDRNKLSEYMESIRSVEKRLDDRQNLKDFEAKITPDVRAELARMDTRIDEWAEYSEGVDITPKVRLLLDIMVLAFQCDATRVTTFMFGNSANNRNFSFLEGVFDTHHSISHHKDDPRNLDQYERINRWHIEQYAYMLEKMQGICEGEGTLLDNSMVMIGSGLRDGNRHSCHDLPIVVAGKGGGKLKTGQNLKFAKDTPFANLHQTMMKVMGLEDVEFADSTGELCEILA
ncbi:MAG: DUF1552 domain-containing protein [Bacteroidia bacterium]|nr:DUF1552 domain-containing protein [Bacteroidia bacterium]